jgi:exonuclease VII large subunit
MKTEQYHPVSVVLRVERPAHRCATRRIQAVLIAVVLTGTTISYAEDSSAPQLPNAAPSLVEPRWQELTPHQRELLAPLASRWDEFTDVRKRKWVGIARRYPAMTPQEQLNVKQHMGNWSKLTAAQRENARTRYKMLRTMPPQELRALEKKWREYDALPEEQKEAMRQAQKSAKATSGANSAALSSQVPKLIAVAP